MHIYTIKEYKVLSRAVTFDQAEKIVSVKDTTKKDSVHYFYFLVHWMPVKCIKFSGKKMIYNRLQKKTEYRSLDIKTFSSKK